VAPAPTIWNVARRPRWIAALVFALALAGAFAALGQWQLDRAVSNGYVVERETESVLDLDSVAEPQAPVQSKANGQLVRAVGVWVPGDFLVLEDRHNAGEAGYWVVGHLAAELDTGVRAGLPVALGWTSSKETAEEVADSFGSTADQVEVTGRFLVGEAPQDSDFESGEFSSVSPAALVNLWEKTDAGGIYGGYVVAQDAASGLQAIDSPAPSTEVEVNWLNIFYAAEWVVFAGFAIFLWYRLVRDAWEREMEELAEQAADVN
jgi:cytochrome oxidase assembly protein ShyY1